MPQVSVNSQRFDPYQSFTFRVKWDGKYVAGFSQVSTLKPPGRAKYDAITLERGITYDTEFWRWANQGWNYGPGAGAETSLKEFRKDITIELYNEAGQVAIAYKIHRCWVSELQSLPDLDGKANAVAIEKLKIENEGWERDNDVAELSDPTGTEPSI